MFGLPWRVSFAPAVLLALDCRALVLVRRGVCRPFLLALLALDCRAVDIGPPWCLRCLGWLC